MADFPRIAITRQHLGASDLWAIEAPTKRLAAFIVEPPWHADLFNSRLIAEIAASYRPCSVCGHPDHAGVLHHQEAGNP